MDELFEKFKRGEVPNVLELMAAISELSELWPTDGHPHSIFPHTSTHSLKNIGLLFLIYDLVGLFFQVNVSCRIEGIGPGIVFDLS
ncbi:unnamed protein product, partial [marine sediment metagenome]